MSSKLLFLILYALILTPVCSHGTSRCEDYLQVLIFPEEYAAPALESKINAIKTEPRATAIGHFDQLAATLSAEIERIRNHHLVANDLYRGEFTSWDTLNPLNWDRKGADTSIERLRTYLTYLVYYNSYVLAAATRLRDANGATGFTWFDWYWGYPRSTYSNYIDDPDYDKKKSADYLVGDPENLQNSLFIGNQISSFGISHEAIQTDFSSGDASGYSSSW
ncbi:MAG: hypothetical protein ACXVA9_01455 [Bdellovibrionales bacterium]